MISFTLNTPKNRSSLISSPFSSSLYFVKSGLIQMSMFSSVSICTEKTLYLSLFNLFLLFNTLIGQTDL